MTNHSQLVSSTTAFLYPVILVFGFYVVLHGHLSPGGGFQGGAILGAVFICRYLVSPNEDLRIRTLQTLEKLLFIAIVLLPMALLFIGSSAAGAPWNVPYMIAMNILIGLKVCAGLTVIFYRFVFYEGGSKWTL